MSRPKKMLPVVGQEQPPKEAKPERPDETAGCSDGCCAPPSDTGSGIAASSAAPTTREANPEVPEGTPLPGAGRTVVRVEGMDCASCALTVEKTVSRVPGVRRATVNFAAGRLDAEHDGGVPLEEIEAAVEAAGFGVGRAAEAERPPFWRTKRALSVFASALLFLIGLSLGLSGAPEIARVGVYLAAIVVGACPSSGRRSRDSGHATST
jgi:Cd2+/Zn2+-exporting ATPase